MAQQTLDTDHGILTRMPDETDPQVAEWRAKFEARGYVFVLDEQNDLRGFLQTTTGHFLTSYPTSSGIEVCLWSDFFNPFTLTTFDADEDAYLDAVEVRFNELFAQWDAM